MQIENFGDFYFTGNGETLFQSIENFYFTIDVDSPKLKLNNVHADVRSKNSATGAKGIEFKASANNKNIISGAADYSIKHDGKTEIEGHGNVKIFDQQKTAKFVLQKDNKNVNGLSVCIHLAFLNLIVIKESIIRLL